MNVEIEQLQRKNDILQQQVDFLELVTGFKNDLELYEKHIDIANARFSVERVEELTIYQDIQSGADKYHY